MINTEYFEGGFLPNKQAQNRAEEYNSDSGTYTRWDESGTVLEQRPLTTDEISALNPPEPIQDTAESISAVQSEIAKATSLSSLRAAVVKLTEALIQAEQTTNN